MFKNYKKTKACILLLMLIGLFLPETLRYSSLATAFTYQLLSVNIFHFLGNALSMWTTYNERVFGRLTLPLAYIISVISVLPSEHPVAGISALIFSIIGFTAAIANFKYFITSLGIIGFGFLLPNLGGLIHLIAFMTAFTSAKIYQIAKQFNDTRHYHRK